jgi:hypothetical protein
MPMQLPVCWAIPKNVVSVLVRIASLTSNIVATKGQAHSCRMGEEVIASRNPCQFTSTVECTMNFQKTSPDSDAPRLTYYVNT